MDNYGKDWWIRKSKCGFHRICKSEAIFNCVGEVVGGRVDLGDSPDGLQNIVDSHNSEVSMLRANITKLLGSIDVLISAAIDNEAKIRELESQLETSKSRKFKTHSANSNNEAHLFWR